MNYTLVARRFYSRPAEQEASTVSSWQEARDYGRKSEAVDWSIELTVTNNGATFAHVERGEGSTPESVGVGIRMVGMKRQHCPSVEQVVDMVNALWGSRVLSRETLRANEVKALWRQRQTDLDSV